MQSVLGKPSLTTLVSPRLTWVSGKQASFFRKSTLLFMATGLESPEFSESPQATSSIMMCDLALETIRKQLCGQLGNAYTGLQS